MSNATVSSQVFVVRNAGALSSVSSGTMVLYADGTYLYAQDSSGNIYNLSSPTASMLSIAANDLTDITITSVANGHILQYNSSSAQWENGAISLDIDDLADVNAPTPTDGYVLTWVTSANEWQAVAATATVTALNNVGDVNASPTNGQALVWNSSAGEWQEGDVVSGFSITDGSTTETVASAETITFANGTGTTATVDIGKIVSFDLNANLDNLNDVSAGSPNPDDILQWSGAAWVNGTLSIDDLSDVDTTSVTPSANQVLLWDGAQWEPGDAAPVVTATTFMFYSASYAPAWRADETTSSAYNLIKAQDIGQVHAWKLAAIANPLPEPSNGAGSGVNVLTAGGGSATEIHSEVYVDQQNVLTLLNTGSNGTDARTEIFVDTSVLVTDAEGLWTKVVWNRDIHKQFGITSNTTAVPTPSGGKALSYIYFDIDFLASGGSPSTTLTFDLDLQFGVRGYQEIDTGTGTLGSLTNDYASAISVTGIDLDSTALTDTSRVKVEADGDSRRVFIYLTPSEIETFIGKIINRSSESSSGVYTYSGFAEIAILLKNFSTDVGTNSVGSGIYLTDAIFQSFLID